MKVKTKQKMFVSSCCMSTLLTDYHEVKTKNCCQCVIEDDIVLGIYWLISLPRQVYHKTMLFIVRIFKFDLELRLILIIIHVYKNITGWVSSILSSSLVTKARYHVLALENWILGNTVTYAHTYMIFQFVDLVSRMLLLYS